MKVAIYSTHNFERDYLRKANNEEHELIYLEVGLTENTVLLANDQHENEELIKNSSITYTDCATLCKESDIVTLHIPLSADTRYLINRDCISTMKPGVMLINTSRGGGVYEEEEGLFFEDHSDDLQS